MTPIIVPTDPVVHAYASLAEVKDTLELTGETFADPDIERALASASSGIDKLTERRFWLDADTSRVRYYTPDDPGVLRVDDLAVLTSLASSPAGAAFTTAWVENTDFVLEPLNASADDEPWTTVRVHPSSGRALPCVPRSVKVTGQFGWPALPPGVKDATIILTSKLVRRVREAPFGVIMLGADVAMRIARSDPDVMFLIGPYMRYPVAIA